MAFEKNVGGKDRLLRGVLAVLLTVVAVAAYRQGNRSRSTLAAIGALAMGFNATTCFCGLNRTLGIDTTADEE